MASTFVNNLRLEEMNTGEQSGTWGTKTNTNLELIGEALGFGTEAITTNANTHDTTVADATSDAGRAIYISYTGALDSDCTITIGPDTMKRVHIIKNATTDSGSSGPYNILIKQGSGAGAAVTIPNGDTKIVSLDGGGSGAIVTDVLDSLSVIDLKVQDDLTVSDDILLSSDSAIIKFGADADTTLTHTDGTGLTLNSTNKLTFGDAASFVQQSSDGVLRVDGEATIDLNASTAVTVSNDLKLDSDAAVLGFGSDNDVTLTHVADTALLLNDAIKLTFRDSALAINSSTDGQLDIDADTEVEITAPTIDLTASTKVTVSNDIEVTGRSVGVTVSPENDGSFDLSVSNDFTCTTTGTTTITFTNAKAGQSGNIKFVNGGSHSINADTMVAINADSLSTLGTTGTYHLAYYVTADSGNDTILVSVSGILT
tara:strand:+ start:4199 stop:5482 length:1284 start_codon:yes stop_codon:yes gene_type:complete